MQGQPAKVQGAGQPVCVGWGSLHLGASWEFLSALPSWTAGGIEAFSSCQSGGTVCTEPFPHPIPGFSKQGLSIHQWTRAQLQVSPPAHTPATLSMEFSPGNLIPGKKLILPRSCVSHALWIAPNRILPDSKLQTASHAFLPNSLGSLSWVATGLFFPSYATPSP